MSRIRSLHPAQTTDEDFVAMSFEARLFTLHLRCEADDSGIFEWKPLGLKMRIFPGDDVDVSALLEELVDHRQVRKFEVAGKAYGAIRNFRKYQRPKKPNSTHPCPEEIGIYTALTDASSEPVGNQFGTSSEISLQREEGGDKMEEVGGNKIPLSGKPDEPDDCPNENQITDVSRETIETALNEYQIVASTVGMVVPSGTARQRKLIGARLRSHSLDDWRTVLRKIRGSPFLQGNHAGNGRPWSGATLDWVCKLANFEKTMDGNYDKSARGDHREPAGVVDDLRELLDNAKAFDRGRAAPVQGDREPGGCEAGVIEHQKLDGPSVDGDHREPARQPLSGHG